MKILEKNGYKFASGLFWQIADENKRTVNLAKIKKDTGHNMYCKISSLRPTWGFCKQQQLSNVKKVAALGKFIVESSHLTGNYANSIICYKFSNSNVANPDANALKEADLFGYIIILNGTICPDGGEYVADFTIIYEAIISRAKKYEIEMLYLPLDVAGRFFSIFERLSDALHNDQLLTAITHNLTTNELELLQRLNQDALSNHYQELIMQLTTAIDLPKFKSFISEVVFAERVKKNKDLTLKYLIANIHYVPFSSEQIYWQHAKFTQRFNNALLQPLNHLRFTIIKNTILLTAVLIACYLVYSLLQQRAVIFNSYNIVKKTAPIDYPVTAAKLFDKCIIANDRYFNNSNTWLLTKITCNANQAILTFSNQITPFPDLNSLLTFTRDVEHTQLNGKVGILNQMYHIAESTATHLVSSQYLTKATAKQLLVNNNTSYMPQHHLQSQRPELQHSQLGQVELGEVKLGNAELRDFTLTTKQLTLSKTISELQKMAQQYSLTLRLKQSQSNVTKFTLISSLSPLFLFNHGVLSPQVALTKITANLDQVTGFYIWEICGEIY